MASHIASFLSDGQGMACIRQHVGKRGRQVDLPFVHINDRLTAIRAARVLVETPFTSDQAAAHGVTACGRHQAEATQQSNASRRPSDTLSKSGLENTARTFGTSSARTTRSACAGDEVLRSMGGGYLVITTLCTLGRAIFTAASIESRWLRVSGDGEQREEEDHNYAQGGKSPPARRIGRFGVAQEMEELLLLLASLLRLGSNVSNHSEGAAGGEEITPSDIKPPLVSEVEAALAAAEPTALRRRKSAHTVARALPHFGDLTNNKRGGLGGRGRGGGNGVHSDLPRPKYGPMASHAPGPGHSTATSTATGSGSKAMPPSTANAAAPVTDSSLGGFLGPRMNSEPQRPKVEGPTASSPRGNFSRAASCGASPLQKNPVQGRGSDDHEKIGSGPRARTSPGRSSLGFQGLPPGFLANTRAAVSSTSLHGARGRRRMNARAVEHRVPTKDFEQSCGSNFAVLVALRWSAHGRSNSGSHGSENGFDMLARVALRESSSSTSFLSSTKHGPWWRSVSRAWWRWWGNAARGSRSSSTTAAGGFDRESGRWWVAGDVRRMGDRFASRRNAQGRRNLGLSEVADSGSSMVGVGAGWTGKAAEEAERLPSLASQIIRDHFLPKVCDCVAGIGGWALIEYSGKGCGMGAITPRVASTTWNNQRSGFDLRASRLALCLGSLVTS